MSRSERDDIESAELLREAIAEGTGSAQKTIALLMRVALSNITLPADAISARLELPRPEFDRLCDDLERVNPERADPVVILRLALLADSVATTPAQHGVAEILRLFADLRTLLEMARGAFLLHVLQGADGLATARRAIVHAEVPDASATLAGGVAALKRYLALTYHRPPGDRPAPTD